MLVLIVGFQSSQAVQVSADGHGQVLIYPYYSVNNNLNTLYSVVNTTPNSKAIAMRFLEGDINREVLHFNVYLSAYDVWTGALVPTTSTLAGHVGEASVLHVTNDTSCAPYLNKSGQEFLPFVIDVDLDDENKSMQRATEGHLEVIEMGELTGAAIAWADHGSTGVPADCGAILADWDDNDQWDTADLDDPTGGLFGSASLVNVAEGIAFSYDAVALQDFWQGAGMHFGPGAYLPNLDAAFPESKVLLENGELAIGEWEHGFQAVSAVLMKSQVINEYSYEEVLAGKTEWVLSFPTKGFHTTDQSLRLPFTEIWDGMTACDVVELSLWDRETIAEEPFSGCGILCPPGELRPQACHASNVIEFIPPALNGPPERQQILGSTNTIQFTGPYKAVVQSGWGLIEFATASPMTPLNGASFAGLPVTGFSVQQFTNANAQPGLLAQYGALFGHKYRLEVESETGFGVE